MENPPLLLVCDLDRIVIHTNFTGTVEATYDIPLEALAEPRNVEIMRAVFHDPEALRPGRTSAAVTQDAARHFAEIAAAMRGRGLDPAAVAHFLDRLVFCLFAEDTRLLPDMVFSRIVTQAAGDPARFGKILGQLFDTMATGGDFGLEPIRHFNGNLFDDRTVLDLTADDVKRIAAAASLDWSAVDPSIFGTLFERGLDPNTRAQLGAHFTSRADIELVVDAVVMAPLRREWAETKAIVERLLTTGKKTPGSAGVPPASSHNAAETAALPGEEPDWPKVDFIIGNPPFLGDKLMRRELGDAYVDQLRALYADRIPGQSDLCCYWFEKARAHIAAGKCKRAGLLATQGIRGGANREVLKRIKDSGGIFWAESDRPWILDGATVHVSMVAFDDGEEKTRTLDGKPVPTINANLTAAADTVTACPIPRNRGLSFLGNCKGGPFDIPEREAVELLATAGNPTFRANSDVVRPVANSEDLLKTRIPRWLIDSADLPLETFVVYERPYRLIEERVKPKRDQNRDKWLKENWWRPQRMRPEMRNAIATLPRFLVTPTTAKHRSFMWLAPPMLPDHQLIVFARSDDYFFGVVHSRFHEVWALAQGTQLRERESGFRYTPTTCFETFPFPETHAERDAAIAAAAKELNELRENWLNPPEWTRTEVLEFPGTVGGPWNRYIVPGSAAVSAASGSGRDARARVPSMGLNL